MKPKTFFRLLAGTYQEWSEDKAPRLGAALAYYTVFAIAPLLIIAVGIAGLIYGEEAARGEVARDLDQLMDPANAAMVEGIIRHTSQSGAGGLATIVGTVTLLFGAAGGFWQLQDSLNTVWKVAPKPGRGILGVVRDRLLSFLMVLLIGVFLLGSLAVTTTITAVSRYVRLPELPAGISLWQLFNDLVSILSITVLFALIYKILPDIHIPWGNIWFGAALTALLFTIGKELLALYLGYASLASAFGAAGSLVLMLFWIYYSAQIFLFGAEFTRVYTLHRGSPVAPTTNAVFVTPEELACQGMPRSEDLEAAARTAARGR
jgi:membrane protein